MLVTSASFEEVVHALKAAAEEMKLDTKMVDTWKGVVKLRRGINWWTFGDIVQVDLLAIRDVHVVHVMAGVDRGGEPGSTDPQGRHRKDEQRLVELMRDRLGKGMCKTVP